MKWFDRAITPNEAFFVRYHVFPIPTQVDLATWRLRIGGHVDRPLELSMDELKTKFPAAAVTDRKSTRLNSSHQITSYAVFCLKKKTTARSMAFSSHPTLPGHS